MEVRYARMEVRYARMVVQCAAHGGLQARVADRPLGGSRRRTSQSNACSVCRKRAVRAGSRSLCPAPACCALVLWWGALARWTCSLSLGSPS
eukprot:2970026-Rhodomonas_salina.1